MDQHDRMVQSLKDAKALFQQFARVVESRDNLKDDSELHEFATTAKAFAAGVDEVLKG